MPHTGCALVCVGQENRNRHDKEIQDKWDESIRYTAEKKGHTFCFGHGRTVYTDLLEHIPVSINGRSEIIRAWVIEGEASLLLSKSLLKTLGRTIDFNRFAADPGTFRIRPVPVRARARSTGALPPVDPVGP